ncbi:hypothetical protein [Conexibacter sp. SYSU D00693]|uniref:hypothetical protein n=1 Tax=Conexibacter sp. SYSU D00693 TaxID=2812560 RepID=UPI00196B2159|nr:hypothetical protein [Conexibacter sp. SYSU D00693]
MGLFGGRGEDGKPHRLPGYAALAREDVKDARRRRPDVDLAPYAAARGLDHLGSQNAAGYFAALPLDEQLQFNVLRGTLPGGRPGCLFHWVRAWPAPNGESSGGTFYGWVWNPPLPKGWWKPDKSDLPYVGWLFNGREVDYEEAVGIPHTVAATLVPEASLLGPGPISFDNKSKPWLVGGHREKLGARGLRGFDLTAATEPPAAVVDALMSSRFRDVLANGGVRHKLFELFVSHGTLCARRNGFAKTEAELDELAEAVCVAGDALRDACLALADPQPFGRSLPTAPWPPQGVSLSGRFPPSPWLEAFHGLAARTGMVLEEPALLHRAFPSLPVPGTAFAVLRGALPESGLPGRLSFHAERPVSRDNQGRTAVLLMARPDAATTPAGGVRLADRGLTYAVQDGVFSAWTLRSSAQLGDLGDLSGLVRGAVELGRELGVLVEPSPAPAAA